MSAVKIAIWVIGSGFVSARLAFDWKHGDWFDRGLLICLSTITICSFIGLLYELAES